MFNEILVGVGDIKVFDIAFKKPWYNNNMRAGAHGPSNGDVGI